MADFIYCLNTSTIRPAPLRTKIAAAQKAGYAAIELWHDEVDEFVAAGHSLSDVRKLLDDAGLQLASMVYLGGWFETIDDQHSAMLVEVRRRMDQAAHLKAGVCIAGPPLGKADRALGVKHYAELLAIGREVGVKPALEFLGFVEEFNKLEMCLETARATGDPDACVVIDPFHLHRGGSGIEAFQQASLSPHEIGVLHFNDAPREPAWNLQRDEDRVMPGDGCLDLKGYVAAARACGYRGALSLELFNHAIWAEDPYEAASRGLEAMKAVVEC